MEGKDEIYLDEKSGISIEEQKEILSTINGIADKNRRRLQGKALTLEQGGGKTKIAAKKSGAVFPLAVNIAAIVVLCAGALFLVSFNGNKDSQLRAGNAVYNLTERALIEDIRKDTAEKLQAKDREISSISSRLNEVNSQLALLFSGEALTPEQLNARDRLIFLQNSYRDELDTLEYERSQILESSRSREASLRALLDERAREYSVVQQRTSAELESAMRELERLTNERDRLAAMNAQYEAWYLFHGGLAQSTSVDTAQSGLAEENALLEQTVADLQKTIEALSSGSSGQAARLTELEGTVTALRASVSSLESGSAEKDRTISALETERDDLTMTNQTLEQEVSNLRNQINIIRDLLEN